MDRAAYVQLVVLMFSIAIAVFPGVEELDFVGPWEVLRAWERAAPDDGVRVFTVAPEDGVIECAKGLRVLAVPAERFAHGR